MVTRGCNFIFNGCIYSSGTWRENKKTKRILLLHAFALGQLAAVGAIPLAGWRLCETNTGIVEPFILARVIVASDHVTIGYLLAKAVARFVREDIEQFVHHGLRWFSILARLLGQERLSLFTRSRGGRGPLAFGFKCRVSVLHVVASAFDARNVCVQALQVRVRLNRGAGQREQSERFTNEQRTSA